MFPFKEQRMTQKDKKYNIWWVKGIREKRDTSVYNVCRHKKYWKDKQYSLIRYYRVVRPLRKSLFLNSYAVCLGSWNLRWLVFQFWQRLEEKLLKEEMLEDNNWNIESNAFLQLLTMVVVVVHMSVHMTAHKDNRKDDNDVLLLQDDEMDQKDALNKKDDDHGKDEVVAIHIHIHKYSWEEHPSVEGTLWSSEMSVEILQEECQLGQEDQKVDFQFWHSEKVVMR